MIRSLESWKYLCENHYVDIPMPKGNETDEELDDHAIGCGFAVEKGLKALEIIKEKRVNVDLFFYCANRAMYNNRVYTGQLTYEEYELLKEVLL